MRTCTLKTTNMIYYLKMSFQSVPRKARRHTPCKHQNSRLPVATIGRHRHCPVLKRGESKQGDADAASLLDLTRQVDGLTKMVIRMTHATTTETQAQVSSKRSKPPTLSLPVEEQSRCALLSQTNEIIEITNDDEDNAFVSEPVALPKTQKTPHVHGLKKKRSLSPDEDGTTTRDTLRAAQGRIKKKRDGALRN